MIYLDHNATSPLLPEVLDAMRPWLGVPANPASVHAAGRRAAAAVDRARNQVAALVDRDPAGVVFTSGATEATHQALRGLVAEGSRQVWVSAIEHPCVAAALHAAGATCRPLEVAGDGRVVLGDLGRADLVVCMAANHETGVIQPYGQAMAWGPAHVDATQAAGRIPLALGAARSVVLSSHKLGGPGGVGALSLDHGGAFPGLLPGGNQERGRRAGTVHVAGVVGFGAACALAALELPDRVARWRVLTSRLDAGLAALGARTVGSAPRVDNTRCVVFDGLRGEGLVHALDLEGVATSSGAACASGSVEPSPVLVAMGDPHPEGALRISLGPRTTQGEIDRLLEVLPGVLATARAVDDLDW